jgi:hypothetical protein
MMKLLFIVSGTVNTTSQAAAVDESGLLSEDLLEKEVTSHIQYRYSHTGTHH